MATTTNTTAAATSPPRITLYRGWPEKTAYSWGPFVTKLEFHLRLANIPYDTEAGAPTKAPKGKIPYVDLNLPGVAGPPDFLGDSSLIVKHFVEKGEMVDLNAHLGPEELLRDLSLRALLEDKLYFYNMRERWLDNYYVQRDKALWSMPYPVRVVVGMMIHRTNTAMLYGQGTGRFTAEEISRFRREVWETINNALEAVAPKSTRANEKEPYWVLGGKEPTRADAVLFGFVVSVMVSSSCPESTKLVGSLPTVLDYAGRIHDRYFPEYTKWVV